VTTIATTAAAASEYPINLEVEGPTRQSRLSVLLRLLYVIPHMIILYFLTIAMAVVWFISWFAILFTGSYPAGLLRFSLGTWRWLMRATAYAFLLTDKYPPFSLDDEAEYPIRLVAVEEVEGRNRLTTFWPVRFVLAIPHLLIVSVLVYAVAVVAFVAWFAALFTGSVPAGLHNFIAGGLRWYARAYGYTYNLVDEYPPFSLE
jgi:hypothetical protein